MKQVILGIGWLAAGLVFAAPAHADVDTDFANELHAYGNGQQDYNAGIGKIVCERLRIGVDPDAYETAQFISINMQRGATTEQTWQFLGAALRTYCADQVPVLDKTAAR